MHGCRLGAAMLVIGCAAILAACGEEGHDESFEHYGECYEDLTREGRTSLGAFTECDEMFDSMSMYTDDASCVAYYEMHLADTEAANIAARCDMLFPP